MMLYVCTKNTSVQRIYNLHMYIYIYICIYQGPVGWLPHATLSLPPLCPWTDVCSPAHESIRSVAMLLFYHYLFICCCFIRSVAMYI